jgi:hypothetical protein
MLCDRPARRFAQDDAFLEGTEKHLVGCKKREKIEKVTGSQDDGFVGVVRKNNLKQVKAYWTGIPGYTQPSLRN